MRDMVGRSDEGVDRRLFADAAEILATTPEPSSILERFTQLVVPAFADTCAVFTPEPNGGARLACHEHADPAEHARAIDLYWRYPIRPGTKTPVLDVLTSGVAQLHSKVEADDLRAAARGPGHREALRAMSIESALFVPLSGNGGVLAVMSWVSRRADRRYDEADLARASALARLAALAVESAQARADLAQANRTLDRKSVV